MTSTIVVAVHPIVAMVQQVDVAKILGQPWTHMDVRLVDLDFGPRALRHLTASTGGAPGPRLSWSEAGSLFDVVAGLAR